MIDVPSGNAMGTHIGALFASLSSASAPDSDAITRIESKIDTALSNNAVSFTRVNISSSAVRKIHAIAVHRQTFGMDAKTGRRISGIEHLKQSIRDILITRLNSRVMRRKYGSGLFELIDSPQNPLTRGLLMVATAEALNKWEPRFQLTTIHFLTEQAEQFAGHLNIKLTGKYVDNDASVEVVV